MADVAVRNNTLNDLRAASALQGAQQHERINNPQTAGGRASAPSQRNQRPQPQDAARIQEEDQQEENIRAEEDVETQIFQLEQQGRQLIRSGKDNKETAEVLKLSGQTIDSVASLLNELGKATLEIIIGIFFLLGGFVLKVLSFSTFRFADATKMEGSNKIQRGFKKLEDAKKLRGGNAKGGSIKQAAASAVLKKGVGVAEFLFELTPLPFPVLLPSLLHAATDTTEEGTNKFKDEMRNYLIRGLAFLLVIGMGVALLVIFFFIIVTIACKSNPVTYAIIKGAAFFKLLPQIVNEICD